MRGSSCTHRPRLAPRLGVGLLPSSATQVFAVVPDPCHRDWVVAISRKFCMSFACLCFTPRPPVSHRDLRSGLLTSSAKVFRIPFHVAGFLLLSSLAPRLGGGVWVVALFLNFCRCFAFHPPGRVLAVRTPSAETGGLPCAVAVLRKFCSLF